MNKNIKFFLGANSDKGFVSYFEQLQDYKESLQLLILKGGPGSGKSSLMKKICKKAEESGSHVEHIHCASDPSSLDGFIDRTKHFAMVDGTAPHVIDPQLPGAMHHIFNTGGLWDVEKIYESKHNINALSKEISDCHKGASAHIKAAATLIRENMRLSAERVKKKEVMEFAKIICDMLSDGNSSSESIRLISAVTVGKVEFFKDTLSEFARKIYVIDDPWGASGNMLLGEIRRAALSKGLKIITCPCSIIPDRTEHLIIPSEGIAVSVKNAFHSSQEIFAEAGGFYNSFNDDAEMKRRVKEAQRLIEYAARSVEKAKRLHDELEGYYIEAMNFAEIEKIAERIKNCVYG